MTWAIRSFRHYLVSALSVKHLVVRDAQNRAVGSVAAHLLSIQQGACMVRAHDVKATVDAIRVWQAMQNASN